MHGIAESMVVGRVALRVLHGKFSFRAAESVFIALFALALLAGCSTHSTRTVATEQTVQYAAGAEHDRIAPVVTETSVTKAEETKSEGPSGGLLSGTVHVVGQAIALPFRVFAGLITLAF